MKSWMGPKRCRWDMSDTARTDVSEDRTVFVGEGEPRGGRSTARLDRACLDRNLLLGLRTSARKVTTGIGESRQNGERGVMTIVRHT